MNADGDSRDVRLVVLHDVTDGESGRWQRFVTEVARVIGLAPSYLPAPADGALWMTGILRVAAACPGPVLVLPQRPRSAEHEQPPSLHWAVIASDDSPEVERAARLCTVHLLRSGVRTTIVVVLTESSAPPMWEGAGHHAAAWRNELQRRYGRPDRLQVVTGPPGSTIREQCAGADLLLLLWHQAIEADRAQVVRSVLEEGALQPCLLVPLRWVAREASSAGVSLDERTVVTGR